MAHQHGFSEKIQAHHLKVGTKAVIVVPFFRRKMPASKRYEVAKILFPRFLFPDFPAKSLILEAGASPKKIATATLRREPWATAWHSPFCKQRPQSRVLESRVLKKIHKIFASFF